MTPGGLIFLAIVVLWAVYLVPEWARERAQASAAREARLESERLRRTDRSQPRVLLTAGRPAMTTSARIGALASAQRDLAGQRRAMRRRRAGRAVGLLLGLVAAVVTMIGAVAGVIPWWPVLGSAAWVSTAVVAGVLGAANDRRQVIAGRERVRGASTLQQAVASPSRTVPLFDRGGEPAGTDATRARTGASGDTWTPVAIPRPTYTMAARVRHAPVLPWVETAPAPLPEPQPLAVPQPVPFTPERRRAATG